MTYIKVAKVATKFRCECCDYTCDKKSNFEKHLSTQKHKNLHNTSDTAVIVSKSSDKFNCVCGKSYKHRQSLYTHQTKCIFTPSNKDKASETLISQDLILEVVKKQQDQISQLTDAVTAIKDIGPHMGSNNNVNSNNTNQFNINVFLNEDCKNAINMSDFIKSIEVSLAQLDLTKTKGLEKGITQVIMDNMNKLSVYERPLHCTDTKRETLYIKEDDKWSKDNNKTKIKEIIKKTQNKNYTALTKWTKEHPRFMRDDALQMYYAKAMSQVGKSIDEVDDKIIKQVCKQTYVKEGKNMIEEV
jgi:hypothetical protein